MDYEWKVPTKPKELCWRRLCNIVTEEGKPQHNDEFITLSKDKKFVVWLPENSEKMYCIDVEDLKKLPKEEDL